MSTSLDPGRCAVLPAHTRGLRRALGVLGAVVLALSARAQSTPIGAAAPGLSETGVPEFMVLAPAALGLSSPPTDLQALPDGRLVALAGRELALGDGTRWEVFRLSPQDVAPGSNSVAIDAEGKMYAGSAGTFARIEFGADNRWNRVQQADTPQEGIVPVSVHMVGRDWYWHGGSGAVVSWRPGRTARIVGHITDLERAIAVGDDHFLSDRADGSFWRVGPGGLQSVIRAGDTNVSRSITCALTLPDGRVAVGTNGNGLQSLVDGRLVPFLSGGPLAGRSRINDLCPTVPDHYAAAVDNLGIVFFDRTGRTVQVLDRALDHRLARVRRLFYAEPGIVWALLNDGIARVDFPSRISHYESMVSTGLVFAQPYRFEGRLWLLGDGQAQRGIYDADGRLLRFEVDSPPEQFLCSLSTATGSLLACGRVGVFRRENDSWRLVVPGIVNAHLSSTPDREGRWLFVAQDKVGWLRPRGTAYEVETRPVRDLGGVYGGITDAQGALWAELGTARVARAELLGDTPRIEIFGAEHGLAGGWAQLSMIAGEVHANTVARLLRFDREARRFEPDPNFAHLLPRNEVDVLGRPAVDASGRLWVSTDEGPQLFERHERRLQRVHESFPAGLQPLFYTPDAGGPVWFHQRLQLARYDPSMPLPAPTTPRIVITRIHLTNTNRTLHLPAAPLAPWPAHDNSLTVHFLAVHTPAARTVTFEVQLGGASSDWISTGVIGTATFDRLKEGRYRLGVRPVVGGEPGEATYLPFVIEPPWFRTHAAYACFALAALGFIALVAWYAGWRERRDKAKLAHLVAQRTRELNDANRLLETNMDSTLRQAERLRTSEERYRQLSAELERRVAERTEALLRANEQLVATNHELEAFSYSISHDLRAPLRNINGFVDLLRRRNRTVLDPESLRFFQIIATETIRLSQLIDSLLAFARLSRADFKFERVALSSLVARVVAELRPEFENRIVDWRIAPLPTVYADTALLRQVVTNLCQNAIKFTRNRPQAIIEIGTVPPATGTTATEQVVYVRDNGAGFDPKYAGKLFGVFQRLHHTRDFEGTGIGLANAKRIIVRHGGRIWAEGKPGEGATFYFALPIRHDHPN